MSYDASATHDNANEIIQHEIVIDPEANDDVADHCDEEHDNDDNSEETEEEDEADAALDLNSNVDDNDSNSIAAM